MVLAIMHIHAQFTSQVFPKLSDLLDWGQFDAVVLMVPHHLHEPYAQACLRGNKHVLLEKPLAPNVESALHVLEEARKTRTVFMVGEQSPYWPEVRETPHSPVTGVDWGVPRFEPFSGSVGVGGLVPS